jgi:hypothetical protein
VIIAVPAHDHSRRVRRRSAYALALAGADDALA